MTRAPSAAVALSGLLYPGFQRRVVVKRDDEKEIDNGRESSRRRPTDDDCESTKEIFDICTQKIVRLEPIYVRRNTKERSAT